MPVARLTRLFVRAGQAAGETLGGAGIVASWPLRIAFVRVVDRPGIQSASRNAGLAVGRSVDRPAAPNPTRVRSSTRTTLKAARRAAWAARSALRLAARAGCWPSGLLPGSDCRRSGLLPGTTAHAARPRTRSARSRVIPNGVTLSGDMTCHSPCVSGAGERRWLWISESAFGGHPACAIGSSIYWRWVSTSPRVVWWRSSRGVSGLV